MNLTELKSKLGAIPIRLRESDHTYLVGKQEYEYDSVTKVLARYTPEFKADVVATRVAAKTGTAEDMLKREWNETSSKAQQLGRVVHQVAEQLWLTGNRPDDVPTDPEHEPYITGLMRFRKSCPQYHIGLTEVAICLPRLRLGGTIDLIAIDDSELVLIDYKTSKEIAITGFSKMKPPLETLHNCEYNHYALQLNLYSHILAQTYEICVNRMMLVQILPGDYRLFHIQAYNPHVTKLVNTLEAALQESET